jgi:hypothetical protein
MGKTIERGKPFDQQRYEYVLLGLNKAFNSRFKDARAAECKSAASIVEAADRASKDAVWISPSAKVTAILTHTLAKFLGGKHGRVRLGNVLMLEPPKMSMTPFLSGWFDNIIGASASWVYLLPDELAEVLLSPMSERRDVIFAGLIDPDLKSIMFVRGDFSTVVAPLSFFKPSGKSKPDFQKFGIGDYGHTLRFGDYEATTDIVLWEYDSDYRKRMRAKEKSAAVGLGSSIMRLRVQRGLSQADFGDLSRRTISRIESGEIENPHQSTLVGIAKRLGIAVSELESY